jgi:S-adenosylmethionine:tRNA ribosyltransferase-isomerase
MTPAGGTSLMTGPHPSLPKLQPLSFTLPPELEAPSPPEARGMTRDSVRMLVAYKGDGTLVHSHFSELPRFLDEGDLVVLNTSGTLAAEIDGIDHDGQRVQVHLSTQLPAGLWTVEVRKGGAAFLAARAGTNIEVAGGGCLRLLAPYSPGPGGIGVRLWVSSLETPETLQTYLARHGRPIRYGYVQGDFPLATYQNVYVTEPGSAEMPSAGRPFTPEVLTRLVAKGVGVAPLLLHTGVASLEASEPPYAEYFKVSSATAHRVNDAHRRGGRVVAIGTTVVRALESVVDEHGHVHPSEGWTQTVVSPSHPVRSIDAFLTGWHEPEASHLAMLEAIAGRPLLEASYAAALEQGYLWHEFGDVHLILP